MRIVPVCVPREVRASLQAFAAGRDRQCRRHHQQDNKEVGVGPGDDCPTALPRPTTRARREVRSDLPGMTSQQNTFIMIGMIAR